MNINKIKETLSNEDIDKLIYLLSSLKLIQNEEKREELIQTLPYPDETIPFLCTGVNFEYVIYYQ